MKQNMNVRYLTCVAMFLALSFVAVLLAMVTISSTGVYGFLMNAIATCAFTVPAAWVYAKMRSQKGAVIGLLSGVLTMAVCMVAWNYIITPYYMSNDQVSVAQMRRTVAGMLLPVFLPFNLVKGGLNAALAMLLYKPVVGALRRVGLVAQSSSGKKGRFSLGSTLAAAAVLATFVLLFLILIDVI